MNTVRSGEKGYVLVTTAACSLALAGMLGLAVDVGRMYIVHAEMQAYADSAALGAARELDGTAAGLERATDAVAANTNRWNFGSRAFTNAEVEFAASASGPWDANPSPAGCTHVRVTATGTAPLYFMPAVSTRSSMQVKAVSVAGQVPKTSFPDGLFPFSPYAHAGGPDFGFTRGSQYTMRWSSNGKNPCPGDAGWAKPAGSEDRGFIEDNSTSAIRQAVIGNAQTYVISAGGSVHMTPGGRQAVYGALMDRIAQDGETAAASYASYSESSTANGRRLVIMPVNSGDATGNTVLGFGLFLLLPPDAYDKGGNKSWCAEYIGPAAQGSRHRGAGAAGAARVRLLQ